MVNPPTNPLQVGTVGPPISNRQPQPSVPVDKSWAARAAGNLPKSPDAARSNDIHVVPLDDAVPTLPMETAGHGVVVTAAYGALLRVLQTVDLTSDEKLSMELVPGTPSCLAFATIHVATHQRSVELSEAMNTQFSLPPTALGLAAPVRPSVDGATNLDAATVVYVRPSYAKKGDAWVCPLLAKRGALHGWPVALYQVMKDAGVVLDAGITIALKGPASKSPWLRCKVPIGGYSAFRKWAFDARLDVLVGRQPSMWALLVPVAEEPWVTTRRVRTAKDAFRSIDTWGRNEQVEVEGVPMCRVEFEADPAWEPPMAGLRISDGADNVIEVRLLAPTQRKDAITARMTRASPEGDKARPAAAQGPKPSQAQQAEGRPRPPKRQRQDKKDEYPPLLTQTDDAPQAGPSASTGQGRNARRRINDAVPAAAAARAIDDDAVPAGTPPAMDVDSAAPLLTAVPTLPMQIPSMEIDGGGSAVSGAASASAYPPTISDCDDTAAPAALTDDDECAPSTPRAGRHGGIPIDHSDDPKALYYAVAVGKDGPHIYRNWAIAKPAVEGTKAIHKSFKARAAAEAYIRETLAALEERTRREDAGKDGESGSKLRGASSSSRRGGGSLRK